MLKILEKQFPASVKNLASLWPLSGTAYWDYLKLKYVIIWSYTLLKVLKLSNYVA